MNGKKTVVLLLIAVFVGSAFFSQVAISASPILKYSPSSHDFGDKNEGVTDSTTFSIWNGGCPCVALTYTLSESCGWVDVTPTSGSSTSEHDTITVSVDTTGLSLGYHSCDISISSNGGNGIFTVEVNIVGDTIVSIDNGSANYCDTDTVYINITNVTNLTTATIWLYYNNSVVEVTSISNGSLGAVVADINNSDAVTEINWSDLGSVGHTGSFVFCDVELHAIGNPDDTSPLNLDVKTLADSDGDPVNYTVDDGLFTITYLNEEYHNISVWEAQLLMESDLDIVILDVRTVGEYNSGYIEGAILIPVSELEGRIDELDRNKTIIVYCRSGGRSVTACNILVNHGFENVYNMLGGINAWIAAGLPVVVPPIANFTYTPFNPKTNETITFNASQSNDPDGEIVEYYWSYQGAEGQFPESMGYGEILTYSWDNTGNYNVTLKVTDDRGATDNITKTVTVENRPPLVTISYPSEDSTVSDTITITGIASDPDGTVQNVQVRIDFDSWQTASGTTSWSYNWETTSVSDGSHTIYAKSYDGTDYSTIDSIHVEVDNTQPETTYSLSGTIGNNNWYKSDVIITLNSNDETSGVDYTKYQINMGSLLDYTGTFTISDEGVHIINYYSVDNAGNQETTKTVTIKIDKTKPETTYALNPANPNGNNGWYTSNVTITLTKNDAVSGVNETWYKVDDSNLKKYNGQFTISTDGNHAIEYYSVDMAGNEEQHRTINIKIDKTKSTIILGKPQERYLYIFDRAIVPLPFKVRILGKITVETNANDNTSGIAKVQFYIDGKLKYNDTEKPYKWTYDVPSILFHRHRLKIKAIDNAGNVNKTDEMELWIFNL